MSIINKVADHGWLRQPHGYKTSVTHYVRSKYFRDSEHTLTAPSEWSNPSCCLDSTRACSYPNYCDHHRNTQ